MQFLVDHFNNLITILELMAFIFSINCFFDKKNDRDLILFPFVLGFIFLYETLGAYIKLSGKNIILYNLADPFVTLGYLSSIYRLISFKVVKSTIVYLSIIYILIFFIDLFLVHGFDEWNTITTVFGSMTIVLSALLSFYYIGISQQYFNLMAEPIFWICSSMILYFLPSAVITSLFHFLPDDPIINKTYSKSFIIAQKILNTFHYGLLSFAFICRRVFTT